MDHLPEPVDPISPAARVAYIAEPYDGGSFLDYRSRHPMLESHSVDERQSYLQTWLYFGLLHEILGDLFEMENYVDRDEQGPVVRTTSLHTDFNLWIKRVGAMEEERRDSVIQHIQECFNLWHQIILRSHWSPDFRHGYLPNFETGFRQSLAALGETVFWTFKLVYKKRDRSLHTAWDALYTDESTIPTMQRHGWCPNEAARLLKSSPSVAVKHFAARISKTGPERLEQHRLCTTQICKHAQMDLATYRSRHVGDCECEDIGPDLDAVVSCLTEGASFPVLRISGTGISDLRLDIVRWNAEAPYVALSHVWADGLGNPSAMKLPRCQVLRLHETVRKLEGHKDHADGRLLLWCDTLCCPVESHLKPLALGKIRVVYENAAYVLVLDSSLSPYNHENIGAIETSIRLLSSPWMGRLWTMQESALAKRLLVQMADQFVDVDDLRWDALKGYGAWLKTHAVGRGLMTGLIELRDIMQTDADSIKLRLSNVFGAVRFRRVSYPSDEPGCLATLLDLDPGTIVREEVGDRMPAFWTLLARSSQGIPKDIVFNTGLGRVEQAGFRWAPSTFMYGLEGHAQLTEMLTHGLPERMASLTRRGIRVSYPAWELKVPSVTSSSPEDVPDIGFPFKGFGTVLRLRHSSGDWYTVGSLTSDWNDSNPTLWSCCVFCESLVLIFPEAPTSEHEATRAVLGSVVVNEAGEQTVRTITVVGAMRAINHQQAMWNAGLSAGQKLRDEASSITEQEEGETVSRLWDRAWELAREMLRDSAAFESMCSIPRLSVERSLYDSVLAQLVISIVIAYQGCYLIDGRQHPAETGWIID